MGEDILIVVHEPELEGPHFGPSDLRAAYKSYRIRRAILGDDEPERPDPPKSVCIVDYGEGDPLTPPMDAIPDGIL